jgi:triacylglycerol lipase
MSSQIEFETARPVKTERNPVLLVHGMKDDSRKMAKMAAYLRGEGWEAHTMNLVPSWGQVRLEVLAQQLADFIDKTIPEDGRFDLVGFSMGGLVSQYYLQRMDGLERVQRWVTISAPHNGSLLAWLIQNPGCRQMRPGSAFLQDLKRDADRLKQIQFTSIWTPFDLTIVPASSSVMHEAEMRKIWCVAHPLMVWERRSLRTVAEALSRPLTR